MENKVLLISKETKEITDLVSQLELNDPPIGVKVVSPSEINFGIVPSTDIVVIDVSYTGNQVGSILQEFRRSNSILPLIVISDQTNPETAVYYFNMGADDFIRKPYDTMELICRIKARLRVMHYVKETKQVNLQKSVSGISGPVHIGEVEVDFDRMIVIKNQKTILLTPKEAGILKILYLNKGKPIPRAEFLKHVWFIEGESFVTDRVIDTNIVNIRKKIGDTGRRARYIKTLFGIGYMLIEG